MFIPNYENIVKAARNEKSDRIPLYEHIVAVNIMEQILGCKFTDYYKDYCDFHIAMGYDTVPFECGFGGILPGGGALGGHKPGVIKCRKDFDEYPWDTLFDRYIQHYENHYKALAAVLPEGMKAVGGVGNGVFECVQDLTSYETLCYIRGDDEELYADLFSKVGDGLVKVWEYVVENHSDMFCVFRFGDDLGFKSATLIPPDDIREFVIPQYRRITDIVHQTGKPFLLHSCGNLLEVMDDIIDGAKIDAKHSNEDIIAPFSTWLEDYGRIGNFGGLDTDMLCDLSLFEVVPYVTDIYNACVKKGRGVAIGSGNSITPYVSLNRYVEAYTTIRRLRGEDI